MPGEKLRLLFGVQRDLHGSPSATCPAATAIAELPDSGPDDPAQTKLKEHVADCPYCAAQLANAIRSTTAGAEARYPSRKTPIRQRYFSVAAAISALAVAMFILQPGTELMPEDSAELRNAREPLAAPALTFPTEGQVVAPANITVRWTPVTDAMHYSVRIVDDYGRIILDSFADTAEFTVPPNIRLAPGSSYYVKIDAFIVGDKAVSSSHIYFTVED